MTLALVAPSHALADEPTLGPAPAVRHAHWWGADMGQLVVPKHVFQPDDDTGTFSVTVLNGGVGAPRWIWTDSGWVASGMSSVNLAVNAGKIVSFSPAASEFMSAGKNDYQVSWAVTGDGPAPSYSGAGLPNQPGTHRFESGTTFQVVVDLSDVPRSSTNQWLRVSSDLGGNIGYLGWSDEARDWFAIIPTETVLSIRSTKSKISADGESTATIEATYKTVDNVPVPGETVHLSLSDSSMGALDDAEPLTDENGVARAILTSKTKRGDLRITGRQDGKSASVTVKLLPAPKIKGRVTDGHGHALEEARVELFVGTSDAAQEATETDSDGNYVFDKPNMKEDTRYWVKAILQDKKTDPSDFRVLYWGAGHDAVYAKTFCTVDDASDEGVITRDLNFGNTALVYTSGVPPTDSDEVAAVYFHTKQAVTFWEDDLSLALNAFMPEDVIVGRPGNRVYHEGWADNHDIYIDAGGLSYSDVSRPHNREWHEFAHHAMFDVYDGQPGFSSPWPWHSSGGLWIDANHAGWTNDCSADSWVEGWAEFFASAMKGTHNYVIDPSGGSSLPWIYSMTGGALDLELNEDYADSHKFVGQTVREEFVVARILWDFYDSDETYPSGSDDDEVSVSLGTIFAGLSGFRGNLSEVYAALSSLSGVTQSQVDSIFLAHGAYDDANSNWVYDSGEQIGKLANLSRPGRNQTPPAPGTGVRLEVRTPVGGVVRKATAIVNVDYAEENLRDFSYEQGVDSTGYPTLYLVAPTTSHPATISVRVKNTAGATSSAEATITSSEFLGAYQEWAASESSATVDTVLTKSFVVPRAALSISSRRLVSVTSGRPVSVYGQLNPAHARARVGVWWRRAGSKRWTRLATVTTGELGSFSYKLRPSTSGILQLRYAGDSDHSSAKKNVTVRARHVVTFSKIPSSLRLGRRLKYSGAVQRGHARKRVYLQKLNASGKWSTVARTTVNRRNRFSASWKPGAKRDYKLRVILLSDSRHYRGESAQRRLRVK